MLDESTNNFRRNEYENPGNATKAEIDANEAREKAMEAITEKRMAIEDRIWAANDRFNNLQSSGSSDDGRPADSFDPNIDSTESNPQD